MRRLPDDDVAIDNHTDHVLRGQRIVKSLPGTACCSDSGRHHIAFVPFPYKRGKTKPRRKCHRRAA